MKAQGTRIKPKIQNPINVNLDWRSIDLPVVRLRSPLDFARLTGSLVRFPPIAGQVRSGLHPTTNQQLKTQNLRLISLSPQLLRINKEDHTCSKFISLRR
jgi:hypothetical protein